MGSAWTTVPANKTIAEQRAKRVFFIEEPIYLNLLRVSNEVD